MRDTMVKLAAATLLACLAGCASREAPEEEVRAVVQAAKDAAEARDAGGLFALIADDYRDGNGNGVEEIRRYLRGWLIAHQSVRLVTRVNSVELPADDLARLSVTVGMVGRNADVATAWDFAFDVYDIEATLAREGGDWRVTRATWRRAGER